MTMPDKNQLGGSGMVARTLSGPEDLGFGHSHEPTNARLTPLGEAGAAELRYTAPPGITKPYLQIIRGPLAGSAFTLPRGVTTLGRGDGADIVLDDTTVSRRHAELQRAGGQVVLRDTGSLNGTYLNRQPISQETPLHDGDEIWTGKYRLLYAAT